MVICRPNNSEFKSILNYISEFELDNRGLKKEQFLILKINNNLIAFGRIRKHKGCDELCSLGVIDPERRKGYGTLLVKELIKISTQPLYLVCIIPEFFTPLNFKVVSEYPPELENKLNYCISELPVPEEYVVMNFYKNQSLLLFKESFSL